MRRAWKLAGGALTTVLALAMVDSCSAGGDSQDTPMACTPGQQINCGCPGGVQGYQQCAADGSSFGPCHCSDGGSGATGNTGGTGAAGNAGGTGGSGNSQPTGGGGAGPGGGGSGPGGHGGAGGGSTSCAGEAFPPSLPDVPACSGDGTPCDAGGGAGTGTCVSEHCFLNCTNDACTAPYECVIIGNAHVCSVLTSCGSRCNLTKAVLCLDPAICITTVGDTYGQCLPECVSNACPYDSGSYVMGCLFEAGSTWYCGFDCQPPTCPGEYDCVTVDQDQRCEPKQS